MGDFKWHVEPQEAKFFRGMYLTYIRSRVPCGGPGNTIVAQMCRLWLPQWQGPLESLNPRLTTSPRYWWSHPENISQSISVTFQCVSILTLRKSFIISETLLLLHILCENNEIDTFTISMRRQGTELRHILVLCKLTCLYFFQSFNLLCGSCT